MTGRRARLAAIPGRETRPDPISGGGELQIRKTLAGAVALSAVVGATLTPGGAGAAGAQSRYVVLNEAGVSQQAAERAIERAGGRVVGVNRDIGVTYAASANQSFVTDVARTSAVLAAARERPIGAATPDLVGKYDPAEDFRGAPAGASAAGGSAAAAAIAGDPFSPLQWDMQMIHATPGGSYAVNQGSKGVLVGVMDT